MRHVPFHGAPSAVAGAGGAPLRDPFPHDLAVGAGVAEARAAPSQDAMYATRDHAQLLLTAVAYGPKTVRAAALDALARVGALAEVAPLLEALEAAAAELTDDEREHGDGVVGLLQQKYGGGEAGAVAVVDAAPAGSVAVVSPPSD